jgi:hypothetical protein
LRREEEKVERSYQKFSWPQKRLTTVMEKIDECLSLKLDELKSIFDENELSMEWEKIVEEVAKKEIENQGAAESPAKEFLTKSIGGYADLMKYRVQEKLIRRLEDHELIKRYTVLNKEFEQRVKEENREKDEKNMNEKRAQKSPKQSRYQKKRGVDNEKN